MKRAALALPAAVHHLIPAQRPRKKRRKSQTNVITEHFVPDNTVIFLLYYTT